jgi:hypothetical protein
VIAFSRGDGFVCIVNFGQQPVEIPTGTDVLLGSAELVENALPQDTTVWLVQATTRASFDPDSNRAENSTLLGEGEVGK